MRSDDVPEARGLGSYEIAYLCGGVDRVVMVALVALRREGRVKITVARPRITVLDRRSDDPVQGAVLDTVPGKGKALHFIIREMLDSAQVGDIVDVLRGRGLLCRFNRGGRAVPSRRGRRLARKLADRVPAEHRLSVLGVAAFEEGTELHRIFAPREPYEPEHYSFDTEIFRATPPYRSMGGGNWGNGVY